MKLKEIKNKNQRNEFISLDNFNFYSFLSSWEWLDFKEDFWFKTLRLWIFDNWNLIWLFPLIKTKAKRWTYLFSPHAPLILVNSKKWTVNSENYFKVLEIILPQLKQIAKNEWASFVRLNPPVKATIENYENFKKLWFRNAPIHEHAEDTHLLDLTQDIDKIFKNLKKKDRYLIKRAVKEWVKVRIDNKPDHIETLIKMHHDHSKKVWYVPFSEIYIKNLYKHFWNNIRTISTRYNNQVESILMTIKFNETCNYYIAASDIKNKKFSPNYLAQRTAIKQAKEDWAKIYNFWWVSPDKNPKHPLAWVSDFKRKWWGYDYFLVHAQDLIVSPKYRVTWTIESIRRIKRWYYYVYPQRELKD